MLKAFSLKVHGKNVSVLISNMHVSQMKNPLLFKEFYKLLASFLVIIDILLLNSSESTDWKSENLGMKFGNDTLTGMTGNLIEKSTIDVTADQTDADYFVAE